MVKTLKTKIREFITRGVTVAMRKDVMSFMPVATEGHGAATGEDVMSPTSIATEGHISATSDSVTPPRNHSSKTGHKMSIVTIRPHRDVL
jgi:hypothetical protein